MNNFLKQNEVLDDLQLNNLMIIQDKTDYRFTSDSVLLSNFVKVGHNDKVAEFCSGSGVISLLVNEKCRPKNIVGFEIQHKLWDMSCRSVSYNNIKNITFFNMPLSKAVDVLKQGKTDVVFCNPPYYDVPKNVDDINPKYLQTKYELSTNLEDIFLSANKILKYSGKLFLVHIPEKLQKIMAIASKYNFVCKKLQFVYPNNKKNSHLILIMFTKKGNNGCEVLKPICLN